MPAGTDVRPEKWSDVVDLYDDGSYSAIWGRYDGSKKKSVGVRWDGNGDVGFPSQGKYPTWFVEPEFMTAPLLQGLLALVIQNRKSGELQAVLSALEEAIAQR